MALKVKAPAVGAGAFGALLGSEHQNLTAKAAPAQLRKSANYRQRPAAAAVAALIETARAHASHHLALSLQAEGPEADREWALSQHFHREARGLALLAGVKS